MDALLFSANAVLPIILLIALGWLLKKLNILTDEFLRVGNKLTFRVLLPVLLFYNVYGIGSFTQINWLFVLYAVCGVLVVFGLAIAVTVLSVKDKSRRGVLIQAAFRSNYAIIGIPLATMLFGESGAAAASVLSAFAVPLFNLLAVITLSVFNGSKDSGDEDSGVQTIAKPSAKSVLLGIVTNPLILGVAAGMLVLGVRAIFVATDVSFRLTDIGFLYTSIKYIGNCATPMALIVLGGQFQFVAVKRLWRPIVFGTVVRTAIVPAAALTIAYFLMPGLGGEHFASYIALFGTPVAVSSAIMVREMGGDEELAGQLVVWTTIASAFTVFITVVIFRAIGVF